MPAETIETFQGLIDTLQRYNQQAAAGLAGGATVPWLLGAFDPVLADDESIVHDRFSREDAAKTVRAAFTDPDETVAAVVSAHMQGALLAAWERDLRARMRSRMRIAAHEAARKGVHGHDRGPIVNGPLRVVKQAFERGRPIAQAQED